MKIRYFIAALTVAALLTACGGSSKSSEAPSKSMASSMAASEMTSSMAQSEMSSMAKSEMTSSMPMSDMSGASSSQMELTAQELEKYNGKDGNPAYVAVDGVIYDVTNAPGWENGEHKDGITAGKDLTDEIKNKSPHGLSALDKLTVVGKLV